VSGSRAADQLHGYFEGLDAAAMTYGREWACATARRRRRLREDFICRCLPFTDRIARRYKNRGEPLDDLRQVARLGLICAVDRYDPDRGSFTAFAVLTIFGEIKRHFRDLTWAVHVTRRMQDLALEVQHATIVLTSRLARDPSVAELADYLQVSADVVRRARVGAAGYRTESLSKPVGDDGSDELSDLLGAPDEAIASLTDKLAAIDLIRLLPHRIQHVLVLRFYGELTQAQIAAELGVSQMHVSRLLTKALSWLRAAMLADVPPRWTGVEKCHGPDCVRVRITQDDGTVRVDVSGEFDRDTAGRLRRSLRSAVARAAAGTMVIDMAGVPFVDAAGVAVLYDVCAAGALAHVRVTLAGAQPHLGPILAAVGLASRQGVRTFPASSSPAATAS
jgi:RNA polymerase sigma-B factor